MKIADILTEEYREEGGSFEDEGNHHDINKIFEIVEDRKPIFVNVMKLSWILGDEIDLDNDDVERLRKVDLDIPIIIVVRNKKLLIVDGYHRFLKALFSKIEKLPAKLISPSELDSTRLTN